MPSTLRAKSPKPAMPEDALWVLDGDLYIGNHRVASGSGATDLVFERLGLAFGKRLDPRQQASIAAAAEVSRRGNNAVANIRLALACLQKVPEAGDGGRRLAAAPSLTKNNASSGSPMAADDLSSWLIKYAQDQPRVPAGNGPESGRWTDGNTTAASITMRPEAHPVAEASELTAEWSRTDIIPVVTCGEHIAENCSGKILREFPSQFLDMPLDDLLAAARNGDPAARKAKKLLFDKRFQKP